MRRVLWLLVCALLSLGSRATAQELHLPSHPVIVAVELPELSKEQRKELRRWLSEMREWREYDQEWYNKIPKGENGNLLRRRAKPEPPTWLAPLCAPEQIPFFADDLKEACSYILPPNSFLDAKAAELASQTQQTRSHKEQLIKGSFLSRLHVDGLWAQPEVGSGPRVYGLIGSHISLVDMGRWQFYGPPGIILVAVPTASGRQLRIGYTWGMSYRVHDFRFPWSHGKEQNASLFISVTKCWLNAQIGGMNVGGMDLAGFSISPKRKE